jgi:6-phosphogluconolactonase
MDSRLDLPATAVLAFLSLCCSLHANAADSGQKTRVYFGTYTSDAGPQGKSAGIYVAEMDLLSGTLTNPVVAAELPNPSFLAANSSGTHLYAVSESRRFQNPNSGGVSALKINPVDGSLHFLNEQPSRGESPCHLVVDKQSRFVLAVNYGGGSVTVLPVDQKGALSPAVAFEQHEGSSVHPRQKGPHAHCINLDANNRFAVCADLGLDQVFIYAFDAKNGSISPNEEQASVKVSPGAGPRHFAFHPDLPFAYVINELDSTVTAFRWNSEQGKLTSLQSVSTLPEDFNGKSTTAEIAVSPDGRFLYGSNRGHDSIVVFSIDSNTGRLSSVSHHSSGGQTPRNFAIAPNGAFLLAANQQSHNVVVFRIDRQTGKLEPTGVTVEIPSPVCVTFVMPNEQ